MSIFACGDGGLLDGIAGTTVPAAPTGLTVTGGTGELTLSWDAVTGADSYDLYWHTANDSSAIPAANTSNVTSSPATITGLDDDTTYWLWVKAKNSAGSSGFSAAASGSTDAVVEFFEKTSNSVSSSYTIVGELGDDNNGKGETITIDKAYTPRSFSVYVHQTQYFKKDGAGVAVDLALSIWNTDTEELLATSTAHIDARTENGEEEVTFTINDAPTIDANTPVLYAVYLPGAVSLDIRGNLVYYASTTDQTEKGVFWLANGTSATDDSIDSFEVWRYPGNPTYDLKFSLTAIER